MKFLKFLLLLGCLISAQTLFAQYDDEENSTSTSKRSTKKEKIEGSDAQATDQAESNIKKDKNSANKTTYMSKKQLSKKAMNKEKTRVKKYKKTRNTVNDRKTVKRMKRTEKHSYQANSTQTAPFHKRFAKWLKGDANQKGSYSKNNKLRKAQSASRENYASSTRQRAEKRKKLRKK